VNHILRLIAPLALGCALSGTAAPVRDSVWVEQRVRDWQPTAREKRWESIGWAKDLRSALALGKKHRRPVFLFTLDGRMSVGRC
jgi:hypothetical protein